VFAHRAGVSLYYERDPGESGDQAVAFVGEAGLGAWLWGWQQPRVAGPHETLVWDLRGTGRSDAPPGPYAVAELAGDLEAVLAAAGVRRVHLVGAGLGGAVALRYAREYGRARSLALFGTPRRGGAIDRDALEGLAGGDLSVGFSEAFLGEVETDRIREWRRTDDPGPAAAAAQIDALARFESGPLYELTLPALVCHGLGDPVVPVEEGRQLAAELPRGAFVPVEGRHLAFAERARAVTDRLLAFIETEGGAEPAGASGESRESREGGGETE